MLPPAPSSSALTAASWPRYRLINCSRENARLPAAAFSVVELDADDGDATCLRCEGAPVGLYDGDVRGGENAWLAERQQKRRPPA